MWQWRAAALAMLGRFDEAREIVATLRQRYAEQGSTLPLAFVTAHMGVRVESLAEDDATAVTLGREGCTLFEKFCERGLQSTAAGLLANALYELDRLDEADAEAAHAAHLGSSDDVATQMLWRQARAKVLARRGDHIPAERLAREAVAIALTTDQPNEQGTAYADLAEVLTLIDRKPEAADSLRTAESLFARKGNLVCRSRTHTRLQQLAASG